MKLSFAKKLTASYLFVVAVTLLFTGVFLSHSLQKTYLAHLEHSLATEAKLIAPNIPAKGSDLQTWIQLQGRQAGCRVTVIGPEGTVKADSERTEEEVRRMDNHASRPEVRAALASGMGESMRHSATLDEDMMYLALPLTRRPLPGEREGVRGVIRLALPLTEVRERMATFQKDLLKAGAAAVLVAFLVAWITMRKISRPLRDLLRSMGVQTHDELGHLARTCSDMAARIEEKVRDLSRERTQLGAILSTLIESIVAIDYQGKLLFLNPAAKKLFGVTSSDVKGRPFLEVLRQSPLNAVLTQTLTDHHAVKKEITLHSPEEHIVSIHALPVDYGEGQTGVLAALHDITELRKLENIRREFVANVSHELKTPLTSIKGYIETLLDGAINDTKHNKAFLETIQEHTNNLSRLIDDVLDLSAIEAERVTYRFEPVGVKDVIDRIVKALEPMAKGKKVVIEAELPNGLPKVRADREKLAQVVMNLIDNAIKFNKAGGQVRVTAEPNGKDLRVRVEDTGRGIAAEDLPRVFERFYRGNKDRSHEVPGTGLGLAIVKHLIEAHQGTVQAKSVLGKGSVFQITLPLV